MCIVSLCVDKAIKDRLAVVVHLDGRHSFLLWFVIKMAKTKGQIQPILYQSLFCGLFEWFLTQEAKILHALSMKN